MNYLERKTLKIVQKKYDEVFSKIESIKYRIESVLSTENNDSKIVFNYKTLIKELESLLNDDLHSIHEWLYALAQNHTYKQSEEGR